MFCSRMVRNKTEACNSEEIKQQHGVGGIHMVGVVYSGSYSNKVTHGDPTLYTLGAYRQGDSIHDDTHAPLSIEKKLI
jgi:hypothetical protein